MKAVSQDNPSSDTDTQKRHWLRNYFGRKGIDYIFVLPVVIILLAFLLYPVIYGIYLSFTNMTGTTGLKNYIFVGFDNYATALARSDIKTVLWNSILWTVTNLVGQLTIGLILALFLNSLPKKITPWIHAVWLIPWVIPGLAFYYVWGLLLNPEFGAFNFLLMDLHIINKPVAWISDPKTALWGCIIVSIWKSFPFIMTALYGGLQSVPLDLYDAIRVDGANRINTFRYLELPYLVPIIITSATLMTIWIFNNIGPVYALTMGGPGSSSMIFSIYIYLTGMRFFRYGVAGGEGVLTMLFLSIFVIIYMKMTTRSEEEA